MRRFKAKQIKGSDSNHFTTIHLKNGKVFTGVVYDVLDKAIYLCVNTNPGVKSLLQQWDRFTPITVVLGLGGFNPNRYCKHFAYSDVNQIDGPIIESKYRKFKQRTRYKKIRNVSTQ